MLMAYYKPQGLGTYLTLISSFNTLTLADYDLITIYGKAFRKLCNHVADINPNLAILQAYQVQRFLEGLSDAYDYFKTSFQTSHDILKTPLYEVEKAVLNIKRLVNIRLVNQPMALIASSQSNVINV